MPDTPLQDVRVLDLTTTLFGPYTTQILGDLGADVIKIESPAGDPVRQIGTARQENMGAIYLGINRNKRSLVLDLKQESAKAAMWRLIDTADMLVHNMRPQKIAALGFDPQAVMARQPGIVFAGLYGYREGGPYSGKPAYDDVIQGEAGIADLFTRRDGAPQLIPSALADKCAAVIAANGILAAYIKRLRSGKGVTVESTMFESMVSFNLVEHQQGLMFDPAIGEPGYTRVLSQQRKPHATLDGHICMLAYTDRQWNSFWEVTQQPDYAADPRFAKLVDRAKNIDSLYQIAGQLLRTRTSAEWLELLEKAQIPAGKVTALEDLFSDPHLRATGFFQSIDHHDHGRMLLPDAPWRLDGQSLPLRRGPPAMGADSEQVLSEAGLSADEIQQALQRNNA